MLSSIDVPISAARIRNELDLPRSSTYHLLNEMVAAGFVVYLPENKTYGLGLAAYSMAAAYSTQQPLVRMATRHLKVAAEIVQGSAHLSRLAGPEIVYLQEVRAPGAPSLITEVGVRLSAAQTASGRVMLACLPQAEARGVFSTMAEDKRALLSSASEAEGMEQVQKARPSVADFEHYLSQVREQGWAIEREEVSLGQVSVAVAVVDHVGRPAAALAVTGRKEEMTKAAMAEVVSSLNAAASGISDKMYGRKEA